MIWGGFSDESEMTAASPMTQGLLTAARVCRIAPNRADAPRDSTIRPNARLSYSTIRRFGNSWGSEGVRLTGPGRAQVRTRLHIFIIPSKHLELVAAADGRFHFAV